MCGIWDWGLAESFLVLYNPDLVYSAVETLIMKAKRNSAIVCKKKSLNIFSKVQVIFRKEQIDKNTQKFT